MRPRKSNRHLPACVYLKSGAYYYVKRGKWTKLSRDYGEAMAKYARLNAPGSGMGELIERTLESADVKASTLMQYRQVADTLKSAFREFSPAQVKPSDIAQFLDHHRKTPSMANRMRSVLKISFANAVRWGMSETNPVSDIKPFKEPPRNRYLEDEEYLNIRENARPYVALMMDMAYATGQRVMDVVRLTESQIREGEIYFEQEKTGNRLAIELNDAIRAIVESARGLHRVRGTYLFHKGNGQPYSYYTVRNAFVAACEKAGVGNAQFRDIRAKSATDAESEGLNPTILLGHSTSHTTKRYLRKKRTIRASGPKVLESIRKSGPEGA